MRAYNADKGRGVADVGLQLKTPPCKGSKGTNANADVAFPTFSGCYPVSQTKTAKKVGDNFSCTLVEDLKRTQIVQTEAYRSSINQTLHSTHSSTQLTRYISSDVTAYWITFVVAIPEVLQRPCLTTTQCHQLSRLPLASGELYLEDTCDIPTHGPQPRAFD